MGTNPSSARPSEPFLTIEPLLDTVRDAVETAGWRLSGVQKTTSYEYDGRWAGESTRSAYVFFHPPGEGTGVSVDVFLDETSQGLRGALTVVLDGPRLGSLDGSVGVLDRIRGAVQSVVPHEMKTGLSLRAGLPGANLPAGRAETTVRLRIPIPEPAIDAGEPAVAAAVRSTIAMFEAFRDTPVVRGLEFGR